MRDCGLKPHSRGGGSWGTAVSRDEVGDQEDQGCALRKHRCSELPLSIPKLAQGEKSSFPKLSGSTRLNFERPRFRTFCAGGLLTDHGPVDHTELVAIQHGLAAKVLRPLVAAVMGQAAPAGQMEGDRGFPEDGSGRGGERTHLPPSRMTICGRQGGDFLVVLKIREKNPSLPTAGS